MMIQEKVEQQVEGVHRHLERTGGRVLELHAHARGEHVDPVGTQFDGLADRRVVRHPTVHVDPAVDLRGPVDGRDRGAGEKRRYGGSSSAIPDKTRVW